MEYSSAMKKNEIMQQRNCCNEIAATWMALEIMILSEVSQKNTNTI